MPMAADTARPIPPQLVASRRELRPIRPVRLQLAARDPELPVATAGAQQRVAWRRELQPIRAVRQQLLTSRHQLRSGGPGPQQIVACRHRLLR